jgi:hypothetical protein
MSHLALPSESTRTPAVVTVLAAWFALVAVLGVRGAFVAAPGAVPVVLSVAFTAPLLAFFVAYRSSRGLREWVAGVDLRLLAGIQAWRFVGFGFLALYANGLLPGLFAWPAGLGDMAIAATAPWIALALAGRADFVRSRRFRLWNWLGILDLVVAVTMGALASRLSDGITTAPMARLPLVLIPAFAVPLMIIFHIIGLARAGATSSRP